MNKYLKILLGLTWLICLTILIVALTDFIPNNIFKSYQITIVITFVILTGLMKEYFI